MPVWACLPKINTLPRGPRRRQLTKRPSYDARIMIIIKYIGTPNPPGPHPVLVSVYNVNTLTALFIIIRATNPVPRRVTWWWRWRPRTEGVL